MMRRVLLSLGIGAAIVAVAYVTAEYSIPVARWFGFIVLQPAAMLTSIWVPLGEDTRMAVLITAWAMWSFFAWVFVTVASTWLSPKTR